MVKQNVLAKHLMGARAVSCNLDYRHSVLCVLCVLCVLSALADTYTLAVHVDNTTLTVSYVLVLYLAWTTLRGVSEVKRLLAWLYRYA
jgi:hypothetical protein